MVPALRAGAEHVGGDYRNSRLSHSAAAGVDDAAVIRRCAVTETPRHDPWAQVRTFDVSTYGDCRMERDYYGDITSEQTHQRGEYAWVEEVDAARAADAAQHQQEIAAK